ncbi:prepilin-type N-terminal cleavage/methylation domain-containing protein [Sulfurimonas sp.]|uniref:prepilin-type N-terminal cleavage/methylation domain-containing protein n=1 Tax=Sulfurimonas sp. TaxID=2022749 RepID=UPI0025E37AB1|nr:prepilin-type N-terminal cleavage/methylation domain-containing protein [Sulfurimonas sp.]
MVRQKLTAQRYAFTMIELIFAIIIISIAVISLPTITDATSKGLESNIVQEAIFAGSAELNGATSSYWDKRSMEDKNVSNLSRVIDINGDCDNNSVGERYRLKPGHINQPFHRRCLDSDTATVANVSDVTDQNLNNAVHGSEDIFTDTTTNSVGYKNTYQSTVAVAQVGNVKTITTTIANGGTNIVILKTQSANVGEVDYFKRRF